MKEGQILVVGCSSSEIAAHAIGCYSSKEVGEAVFNALYKATRKHGLYLAAQCCEHLNRAIIIEEEAALKYGLEMVNVKPQLKAGGSFSTAAWNGFASPAPWSGSRPTQALTSATPSSACTCALWPFRCAPK